MLCLKFQLGSNLLAIPCHEIVEVLPLLKTRTVPGAPEYVAGTLRYRGNLLPVIDVSSLVAGKVHSKFASTRLVVCRFQKAEDEKSRLLGLILENATETFRFSEEQFADPIISPDSTPYLGDITLETGEQVQLIKIDQILDDATRDLLYSSALEDENVCA